MTQILTAEMITELTRDIWSALLADGGLLPDVSAAPAGDITATVEINGAWNGTTCLTCSTLAGRHAASTMFGVDDEDLTPSDIADAVGELVNVVGGNIKSLLPGPTELSLPVINTTDVTPVAGQLELAHEVRFSWMAEPIVVTVWKKSEG